MKFIAVFFCILIMTTQFLRAEAATPSPEKRTYTHAIASNPLAWLIGQYYANYELLLAQRHGIVLEGFFVKTPDFIRDGPRTGVKGSLQYRWHWSPAMESFFIGLYVTYNDFTYNYSSIQLASNYSVLVDYQMKVRSLAFGINIGKRWVWDNGVNVVLRGGWGPAIAEATPSRTEQQFLDTAKDRRDVERQLGGLDFELSVGYAF